MISDYDLIIIGGGPAGTAAAITSARLRSQLGNHGLRILLLEQTSYPRPKVCGEFVSAEALDVLSGLLGSQSGLLAVAPRITTARLFSDGRTATIPICPAAASISRWELDHALWRAAASAGVHCREHVEVQRVERLLAGFAIITTAGTFSSRCVVDASGRWSRLRAGAVHSRRGVNDKPKWIGLKAHFIAESETGEHYRTGAFSSRRPEERLSGGDEGPALRSNSIHTRCSAGDSTELYFFAGGYCGVQPAGCGRLNVCAMVRADCATRLADVFALHPDLRKRSLGWLAATKPVTAAPLIFGKMQAERDGVLCAGDAAAFIDPFVGDGISLALRSGMMAAQSLAPFWSGSMTLADAAHHYAHEHQRKFRRAFRTSACARAFLLAPAVIRQLALLAMQSPHLCRYMVRSTR